MQFGGLDVGCVYKIHFKAGGFYIGQTSNARKRMRAHMLGIERAWRLGIGAESKLIMYSKVLKHIMDEKMYLGDGMQAFFEILGVYNTEAERLVWEYGLLYENRSNDKCLNYGFRPSNTLNDGFLGLA